MGKIKSKTKYKTVSAAIFLFALLVFTHLLEGQKSYGFYSIARQKIIAEHKAIIENIPALEANIIPNTAYLKITQFQIIQNDISLLVDLPNTFSTAHKSQTRYNLESIYSNINELIHASFAGALSASFGLGILFFIKIFV